ncbi:MAG: thermosome subunit [Candidatus Micrarchaeota archaeon]|nr:thermosome subunit [Candidatus Micrarchaeota archaeon]
MANPMGNQPIFILAEGSTKTSGKTAQKNNIEAGKLVADAVRSTLGPKGMDKMLVNSLGDVVITNDGATILSEMQIEHPAAKMMVEVAKTQNDEVGDGTTTAVIIGGELLNKAGELLEKKIHPTVITKGFRAARQKSLAVLDSLGEQITIKDKDLLKKIAMTAMTGKSAERSSEKLSNIAVDAIVKVAEEVNGKVKIDTDAIKIEKKQGGSMTDTEVIDGVIIDKEVVHSGMPKKVEEAKILLVDTALEIKDLEGDAKISIDSPEKLQAFLENEEKTLRDMADNIVKSGANVVLCQKGIDDMAQHFLAKAGVMAARRVKKSDMEKLSKATGAKVVSDLKSISSSDLGYAGLVEERKISGEDMIFVRKCKNPKSVTILIRGGSEHVVDEVERAMEDAVKGIAAALDLGKVVPGGGAIEIELSRELRKYAESFKGREQLAVNAFAEAVEVIPRTLAENAGLDPIDKVALLRAEHDKGNEKAGLDVFSGDVKDMVELGVIEPLKIKIQAIESASEVAEMILRIDDVIAAGGGGDMAASMGQGAAGGMPPMM